MRIPKNSERTVTSMETLEREAKVSDYIESCDDVTHITLKEVSQQLSVDLEWLRRFTRKKYPDLIFKPSDLLREKKTVVVTPPAHSLSDEEPPAMWGDSEKDVYF